MIQNKLDWFDSELYFLEGDQITHYPHTITPTFDDEFNAQLAENHEELLMLEEIDLGFLFIICDETESANFIQPPAYEYYDETNDTLVYLSNWPKPYNF